MFYCFICTIAQVLSVGICPACTSVTLQAPSQAHSPRTKPVPATYNTLHTTNPSNPTSSSLGADLPSPRPVAMTSPQSRMAPETSTHPASAPATTPINATATTSIPSPAPSPIQLSPIAAAAAVQTPPSWETPSPLSTTSPVGSAASPTGTSPIAAAAEAHSAPPPANEPPKEPVRLLLDKELWISGWNIFFPKYSLSPKDQSAAQKAAARKTRMMNRKTKVVVNEKGSHCCHHRYHYRFLSRFHSPSVPLPLRFLFRCRSLRAQTSRASKNLSDSTRPSTEGWKTRASTRPPSLAQPRY